MPQNILPQVPPPPVKKKRKVSAIAVLLLIILTVVLIVLGENFLSDINRWFNPAYSQYGDGGYISSKVSPSYYDDVVPTKSYTEGNYETFRVLLHAAFVIPVLLAALLLYFTLYYRKEYNPRRIVIWPYFLFSIWMVFHLIIETFIFLIKEYEKVGLYIVLLILAGVLTWLALFLQKKLHERQEHKTNQP